MVHINRLIYCYNSVATSSSRNGITKISSPRVARYRRDLQYLWHPIPITKQRRTPPRQLASITRMPWVDTGESNNNNNKLRLRSNKERKRKGKEKGDERGKLSGPERKIWGELQPLHLRVQSKINIRSRIHPFVEWKFKISARFSHPKKGRRPTNGVARLFLKGWGGGFRQITLRFSTPTLYLHLGFVSPYGIFSVPCRFCGFALFRHLNYIGWTFWNGYIYKYISSHKVGGGGRG